MDKKIAVVGLGYVGLPLALAFGRKFETIGYDLSTSKISAYKKGIDPTGEVSADDFKNAEKLHFTTEGTALSVADFIVVAVPTPITNAKAPDLAPLLSASEIVGKNLKKGAIIVYESTVYPGVTEEVCGPILAEYSGLKVGVDFFLGYSPERINPGDKEHTLDKIIKVVSGQDKKTLDTVAAVYGSVVSAGVYKAKSIKTAEAAKVIENTQRDLNIALMNELSIIFGRMGLDTAEVLAAAGTKWNFIPFKPGLVGGHCIGVDPYYLTFKAEMLGYHPQVILAGRRINDGMGKYVAEQTVKMMIKNNKPIHGSRVLILGLTFKENCSDIRNSKVIDIINELKTYGITPLICDPLVEKADAMHEYGVGLTELNKIEPVDVVVAAVPHKQFATIDFSRLRSTNGGATPFIDVKSAFSREELTHAGFDVWRL